MNEEEMMHRALAGRLWFIHEPALRAMVASLSLRVTAEVKAPPAPQASRLRTAAQGSGGGLVAVIPVHGVIEKSSGFFSMFFGGVSTDMLAAQVREAANDPNVAAIVFDIDSPGGDVQGVEELAAMIYQARKQKPITAVSNCMMCSAAYFIGAQASEVFASPSSLTGSIGVYSTHEDDSKLLENLGVKMTLISYGANKTEGNSYEPLSDTAREHMQDTVNSFGLAFEKAVARGRGVKLEDVQKKFGQGRAFTAQQAVKLGLADKIGTLDDALGKHGAARPASGSRGSVFSGIAGGDAKTKRVDGEDLTIEDFAYRGDPEKTAEWKLPIKFSDEEKTKSHIRNAIARFDQTEMPNADEKKKAWSRIKAAAKEHGIEISDEDKKAAWPAGEPVANTKKRRGDDDPETATDDDDEACMCSCSMCQGGDCSGCVCDGCSCEGCTCDNAAEARKKAHAAMRRQLDLTAA